MKYHCPKCNSTRLAVSIRAEAMLLQDDEGNIQTDSTFGDHEWDDDSFMRCMICDYGNDSKSFDTESEVAA